jgi:hypothetical protein
VDGSVISASQTVLGNATENCCLRMLDRQAVMAVGRAGPEPAPSQSPDALTAHQALHPPADGRSALRAQSRMHPR